MENFQNFDLSIPNFTELDDREKQQIPLGEGHAAYRAGQYEGHIIKTTSLNETKNYVDIAYYTYGYLYLLCYCSFYCFCVLSKYLVNLYFDALAKLFLQLSVNKAFELNRTEVRGREGERETHSLAACRKQTQTEFQRLSGYQEVYSWCVDFSWAGLIQSYYSLSLIQSVYKR